MPPFWQQRLMGDVVAMAKRQAQAIVDSGAEHVSILLAMFGRAEVSVQLVHPPPDVPLNAVLQERLRHVGAWGYVYLNEAWTTDDATYERAGVDRVSALPRDDRGESVILTALLKGMEPLIYEAPVEGAPVTGRRLGPWRPRQLRGDVGEAGVVRTW